MAFKHTVVLDFDGVIHQYDTKWSGIDIISDGPVEGIREAIIEIREEYKVIVVSSRCMEEAGITAIKKWLDKHDIIVDGIRADKPPALVYVDDRAICFDGHASTILEQIRGFKPWNK